MSHEGFSDPIEVEIPDESAGFLAAMEAVNALHADQYAEAEMSGVEALGQKEALNLRRAVLDSLNSGSFLQAAIEGSTA